MGSGAITTWERHVRPIKTIVFTCMQGEAYDIRDEGAGCVWNAIVHPINDDFHKISEEIFFFENWKKLTKSEEIINVAFALILLP